MLSVEVVRRADQRRRWLEVGRVLHAGEPRWAPPLRSYDRGLVARHHPYRRSTGAAVQRWLVRRRGAVAGRIAAHHVAGEGTAWFGGFECADDPAAVAALVDAVRRWAAVRGAARLTGPALYTPDDGDAGVLVSGFDHPGGTGRPWHPPAYAAHLAAAGLRPVGPPMPRWRLATSPAGPTPAGPPASDRPARPLPTSDRAPEVPPHAGRLADPALVLHLPAGHVAAVPDVSAAARLTAPRRPPPPTEAAVVRCEGDPAALVPALLAAAAARGYHAVWAPWCAEPGRPADTEHVLVEMVADRNPLA